MKRYYCAECTIATVLLYQPQSHVIRALGINEHLLTRCEKCNDISIFELSAI